MKSSLLYISDETRMSHPLSAEVAQDLNLNIIFDAMARGDAYLRETASAVMLETPPINRETVLFRQAVLRDAMTNHVAMRGLYALADRAVRDYEEYAKASAPSWARVLPVSQRLGVAARLLDILLSAVDALAALVEEHRARFTSAGVTAMMDEVCMDFGPAFRAAARAQCNALLAIKEGSAIALGACVGEGLKGRAYTLRGVYSARGKQKKRSGHEFKLFNAALTSKAEQLRDAGLYKPYRITNAVNSKLLAYFKALRRGASFYAGCLNLQAALAHTGISIAMPEPAQQQDAMRFDGLVDISLALHKGQRPVGNDLTADGKRHIVVTGANQGGKSTFLRSVGCAQMMMQCGMFVAAQRFSADLRDGLFTHFSRREDERMSSGKLDEELKRMSALINVMPRGALLLMNESFASTSEYQAHAIARQIISALLESGVRVIYVTHLYEYAITAHEAGDARSAFLVADREALGGRPFTVREGVPQRTSYGQDLYDEIIGGARGGD